MFDSNRQSTAMRKVPHDNVAAFGRRRHSPLSWEDNAASTARRRASVLLPVLLVIVLAVAAIGLSPTTAALCAKLDDFPCGP